MSANANTLIDAQGRAIEHFSDNLADRDLRYVLLGVARIASRRALLVNAAAFASDVFVCGNGVGAHICKRAGFNAWALARKEIR